ncbi:MAG TPA: DEAD/DEAH box helicase [Candidatus Thermoplasmatota archaeon]|nr:DEAD/DEAH box helicase [Candidatus Thermoplasmatota archaeon]
MKIDQLELDPQIQKILKNQGIIELYPPQAEALPYVLRGEHVVLSIPTAAGKSLVAYLAIVQRLKNEGGKAFYIVPLRALAREKYEDLKAFEELGLKVGISTGDLDESDVRLSKFDIIVCTSEKADSLLRHGLHWLDKIKVLVIDEIHLIHDPTRGPTLEVIIAQIKALNPATQLIALSATIKNAVELADWLGGKLIQSDWRPVVLREGVFFHNVIKYNDGLTKKIPGDAKKALELLVEESLKDGGQTLIFVNNRKSTVSLAARLSSVVAGLLSEGEKKDLKKLVTSMKHEQAEIISIEQSLVTSVQNGVAFHHAGLESSQRRLVEQGFKDHRIKCIVATPTLAAGVNIPARRVIIRDLWRYDGNFGMTPIPILEYKQQAGRAGRPRYDTVGDAITIAKDSNQRDQIFYNYILADTEPIYSKLGSQSALRMHLLAAISTQFVHDATEMYTFIQSTFYAYQTDEFTIKKEVDTALGFLLENQLIEQMNTGYLATLFGSRTSSLYIDPLSAIRLKTALERSNNRDAAPLSFLHAICSTPDIRSLYLRGADSWVEEKAEDIQHSLLLDIPSSSSDEYEWFLSDLKTAFLLEDWIEEKPYDALVLKYNIWPGDVHTLVDMAEWLLHATREYARMYNFSYVSDINNLLLRVQNGCKEELLNLVSLKGIGRVRARALYREGFKSVNELRNVPLERLAKIKAIGKAVATNIKKQIGESSGQGNKTLRGSKR